MKKIISTIIASCLCICMLAGCGGLRIAVDNYQENFEEDIQQNQNVFDDELSQKAYQIVASYDGDTTDMQYKFISLLATTENTKQLCAIDIVDCQLKRRSAERMLSVFEKLGDKDQVETFQKQKDEAKQKEESLRTVLSGLIELEENLISEIENGIGESDEIPNTQDITDTASML